MSRPYLDYYKTILEEVSFDPQLLRKEYMKALKILNQSEGIELQQWLENSEFNLLHNLTNENNELYKDVA